MNMKQSAMQTRAFSIVTTMFVALFSLSAVLLSGCERMSEVMVTPDPSADVLKVGVIQPSKYYVSFTKAAELARTEINEAGGILGMQVEFVSRDNQTSPGAFPTPEATIQVANELIETEKVSAILGPVFSTNAVQVAPIVEIPMLTAATDASVTKAGEFIFVVGAPNSRHGQSLAEFAVNELGAKTAATIHQDADVYSMGHLDAFNARFKELGGDIVVGDVYQAGDKDFSAQLAKVKAAAPDVLMLSSFAPEVPLLIKQAKEMEITATFIGGDGWADPERFFNTLEDNAPLDGSYYTSDTYDEKTAPPSTQTFIAAYTKAYGEAPDGVATSGYDAMQLLAIGIKEAKSTEPVAVRDAIAAIKDYEGATLIRSYDENRNPDKDIGGVFEIRDGKRHLYVAKAETDAMMPEDTSDAGDMTTDTPPATTDETTDAMDTSDKKEPADDAEDMTSDAMDTSDKKEPADKEDMTPDADADTPEKKDSDDKKDTTPDADADTPEKKDPADTGDMTPDADADTPEKKDPADTGDESGDTPDETAESTDTAQQLCCGIGCSCAKIA